MPHGVHYFGKLKILMTSLMHENFYTLVKDFSSSLVKITNIEEIN